MASKKLVDIFYSLLRGSMHPCREGERAIVSIKGVPFSGFLSIK
jgi:hypothetical protein